MRTPLSVITHTLIALVPSGYKFRTYLLIILNSQRSAHILDIMAYIFAVYAKLEERMK